MISPTDMLIHLANASDLRGNLPLRPGYTTLTAYPNRRKLAQIEQLVVHHTGADVNARPSIANTAAYQTGPNAQLPFPGFAYSAYIEADGRIEVAYDIETVTWSQGDGSAYSIDGVGINNYTGFAVCFSGRDPTAAQAASYRTIKNALESVLGRTIPVKGHREVSGRSDTECPGDAGMALVASLNGH